MLKSSYLKEIKTILIDDEDIALHRFRKALAAYPFIKIIGEAKDGKSAVSLINELQPDLIFLDIQMPEYSGLEVLNHLDTLPIVVFVTAYEEYAVKAFEKNSLDYLLKPVEEERLAVTIERIMERSTNGNDTMLQIKQLLAEARAPKHITTIPVKVATKINLVHVPDIYYFEARDKYVYIHTRDKEHLIDHSLGFLMERLPEVFIRVHRTYIVNKLQIREIHKYFKGGYLFIMDNTSETKIKTANSYNADIKKKLLIP